MCDHLLRERPHLVFIIRSDHMEGISKVPESRWGVIYHEESPEIKSALDIYLEIMY